MEIPKGYKQTEVGIIPDDWEVDKIGSFGRFIKDTINPQNFPDKFYFEYSMPSFDEGKQPKVTEGRNMHSNRIAIIAPVLLFNKLNVRQRRIWLVEQCESNSLCSMEFLPFISSELNLKYLRHLVDTDKITSIFLGLSKGTSNSQKRISPSDFLDLTIPVPPIDEQKRIAAALSDMDELIAALNQQIEKKRQIKEGAMQQLLTGKTRLPGFTEPWKQWSLGELLEYEQPTQYLVSSTEYVDNGIPVLTAGKTFILGYTNEDSGIYRKLPVIIFDDFVTSSKFVDFSFKAKSSAMKMLSLRDKKNNLRLIYEMMQLIDFPMTDHKRYWIAEYSKLVIKLPSPKEQNAIALILSDMDEEIRQLEAERDKYTLVMQGMMQELLTGKTRLN